MVTRKKNQSAHPGVPDMTWSQLTAAGLSDAPNARPPPKKKKQTKTQEIEALKEELRVTRELLVSNSHLPAHRDRHEPSDTELATDSEETTTKVGTKRKVTEPHSASRKLKRTRAIDPFESSNMVLSGATGLIENWRLKVAPPLSSPSPQPAFSEFQSPNRGSVSQSPMGSGSTASLTRNQPNLENVLPTFALPKTVRGSKVYPGVKDLPTSFRQNFRNIFIRFVIKQVANSESPWANPDVDSLQSMYDVVYPMVPAQLRHSDAVCHPTITALSGLRNHIATEAITAVQQYVPAVFRQKRLNSIEARAEYIAKLFKSKDDHPILWREYVEGNIRDHPERGGYKITRRGLFQSDPILKTLLGYYSLFGIKEDPPTEDPGIGNRPLGILALVATAVERAYKMYDTGDFIESNEWFDAKSCGNDTVKYMEYIVNDLGERQWNSIFGSLSAFSKRCRKEQIVENSVPEEPRRRIPLPPSDPPSPRDD